MKTLLEVFLIGVGLSMDAFAVAICKGLSMKKVNKIHTTIIALYFGVFQAMMPTFGWLLGRNFEKYITNIDHWIAFVLLAIIGGKMLYDVFFGKEEDECSEDKEKLDHKELVILAIATSIDAFAVGITFAFLSYPIVSSVVLIGCTTFVISFGGVFIGNIFGHKFESKAQIAGGVILILIGLKILLEHLGIISF